ncbi:MAG TPA: tRNA pseudouridine(55) synthase TruB [Firmicutes bacterium]|nr:tRNA pseudouridine(55) synthase TruB [Bacillota bacterium]
MDGIINLLKPAGMTSHQAVNAVRRLVGQKQVGHGGTLDPGACGVLPLFLGKATRLISYVPGTKSYRAEMTLGIATETQDPAGKTTDMASDVNIAPNLLGEAFVKFLGEQYQTPPMISAVRVAGKRLYELARKGIQVEREPRLIRIHQLHIRKVWPEDVDVLGLGSRVLFDVECSAGTYIRTLCVDIGKELGCPAHMSFLVRTQAGPFNLTDAITYEELAVAAAGNRLTEYVLSPEVAVSHLPMVVVDAANRKKVQHGAEFQAVDPGDVANAVEQLTSTRVHDEKGTLIAIARPIRQKHGYWQPEKVFVTD